MLKIKISEFRLILLDHITYFELSISQNLIHLFITIQIAIYQYFKIV